MRELKIAYGSSCFAKVWSNKTITFDALCERLKNTIRTPETVEEYPKLSKAERDRAKDKGGMVGGWLKQGRRKAANVECRSMLTHDIDSADPDFLERYQMLNQYASCLYSTHSHTPEAPRYNGATSMIGCMSGDFPTLLPGQNAISWTGNVTKVEVQPNWRFL